MFLEILISYYFYCTLHYTIYEESALSFRTNLSGCDEWVTAVNTVQLHVFIIGHARVAQVKVDKNGLLLICII